jgi:putative spermidine/putrescine transport system substrate-binding protein
VSNLSRRLFLAVSGIGLCAPAVLSGALAQGSVLRVATWGGSWRDSLDKAVGERLAAKGQSIEYVLGNPDDNIAKLIAARRQGQDAFDVLEFTPAQRTPLSQAGVLERLDYADLSNASTIPAWAREETFVCGQYTVDGIVYNSKAFADVGVAPPTTYTDLRNPKLRGRVAFPDIQNGAHWSTVVALAHAGGGSEAELAPAIDLVNQIAPGYFFSSSTDLATKFGAGDIWVAPWQSGWGLRLRKANQPIDVAYAKIGEKRGALWPLAQGLIKGSPNARAAHQFMNEFLTPEAQLAHGNATGSLPINKQAREVMAKDPLQSSMLLLSDAQLDGTFRIDWTRFDQRKWRETWARSVRR